MTNLEWIAVESQLPKMETGNRELWIYANGEVVIGQYRDKKFYSGGGRLLSNATHWMPRVVPKSRY